MKQSGMLKFTIFVVPIVALVLGGCVNVNDPQLHPIDYRSTVRFVDLANYSTAMTVSFMGQSSYYDMPAGTRLFWYSYGTPKDTFKLAFNRDTKYTLFSAFDASNGDAARTYMLAFERLTSASPFPSDSQLVRFANFSSDTALSVDNSLVFHFTYGTTDKATDAMAFSSLSGYYKAAASASNGFYAVSDATGDTVLAPTALPAAAGRYTVAFFGNRAASTWQAKVFQED
jgi:hypothetical protein